MRGDSHVSSRLRGRATAAVAVIGYVLLTVALTYPLIRRFTVAIPGDGFDGWQNFWNLWWVRRALLEEHTHPWFTDALYYPTGVSLLFHTLNLFNGLAFLPMQLAWGLFPAYNAVVFFSFAISGLGAYLLARDLLGPRSSHLAAFAAGAIFTFSPFHFAHLLGHMQVISMEWVPFYALYLVRTVRAVHPMSDPPSHRTRDALLAAFFLILIALCDWYYVLFCVILTAVVLVWAAFQAWRSGSTLPHPPGSSPARHLTHLFLGIASIWLLWAVVLSPLLFSMIREARQYSFMVPDPTDSRRFSADLLAFVMPQQFHPLWGRWAGQIRVYQATLAEYQVFAGFTVLALALVGVLTSRHPLPKDQRRFPGTREMRGLWLVATIVFFVLALGPVLHIAGQTELLPGGREIPLPYTWLVRVVPFMNISRSVSRYDAMVMLALAMLAAMGLNALAHRVRRGHLITTAALVLIVFEFLPAPFPLSVSDTPAWFATLAADTRTGSVLNLPMNWDRPSYLLHQTTHGKPLVAGYISRDDPRTLVYLAPVFQHFRNLGPDIIAFDLAAQGRQALYDLGVRWVVLDHYQMPAGPGNITRDYTLATAAQIFGGQQPAYQDDRITAYEVYPTDRQAPYLVLGSGWERFDDQRKSRVFTGDAELIVRAPASGTVTVQVMLAPGSAAPDLPREGEAYIIRLPVQPGANPVRLRSREPKGRVEVQSLALESQ